MHILHERAQNGVNRHGTWGNAGASVPLSFAMARRSTNSHAARLKALPHVARLHRADPLRQADEAELKAAADRIAGPAGWYAVAGWLPADVDCRLYRFATAAEAEAMQRWITESEIETRPAPALYRGPQLGVAGADTKKAPADPVKGRRAV